jgi:hypothetical protein
LIVAVAIGGAVGGVLVVVGVVVVDVTANQCYT